MLNWGGGNLGKNKTTAQRAGGVNPPVWGVFVQTHRGANTPRSCAAVFAYFILPAQFNMEWRHFIILGIIVFFWVNRLFPGRDYTLLRLSAIGGGGI